MRRHRLLADHEQCRDLLLPATVDEEIEYLDLAARQLRVAASSGIVHVHQALPTDEAPHSDDELVGVERLDDEVVRAEQQPRDAVERLSPHAREEEHEDFLAP